MARRILLLSSAATLVYVGQLMFPLLFQNLNMAEALGEYFGWDRPYLSPVMVAPPLAWAAVAAMPILRGGRARRPAGLSPVLLFFAPFAYLVATPLAWILVRGAHQIGALEDDPLLMGLVFPFVSLMILAPICVSWLVHWWLRVDARRRAEARTTVSPAPVGLAPVDPGHDASGLPRP